MTPDTLLLISIGGEHLALTRAEFEQARARGRELMPATPPPTNTPADRILDAEGMAQETGVPASWFLEQARQGTIPHIRAGKYVRFQIAEVLDHLKASGRRATTITNISTTGTSCRRGKNSAGSV